MLSSQRKRSAPWTDIPCQLLLASLLWQFATAGKSDAGYTYEQHIPVTCLNRTIDSGEHITDSFGKLQFIPFPTCNETSKPLAFRYGVSETVNCTIDTLSDEQYHLLEYYVHSDVPLTCRVPTGPLVQTVPQSKADDAENEEMNTISVLNNDGPSYTPITFALQGTLQSSHLHIWTDMNVLVHSVGSSPQRGKRSKAQAAPGYVVAGAAYSVPEFDASVFKKKASVDAETEAAAVADAARDPWTSGHGTKVIRGEPLTLTFHVSWLDGGRGIGWPSRSDSADGASSGLLSRLFFFLLAAGVGAIAALYWERNGGRGRGSAWRGEGILGAPSAWGKTSGGTGVGMPGVSYGNGGKTNGYGGYTASAGGNGSAAGGGYGYSGYTSGKRD